MAGADYDDCLSHPWNSTLFSQPDPSAIRPE
jgi:hypothetical protein